jgi:hypothetical protein
MMAHQLSRRFGNDLFSPLNPLTLMNYVIQNHEAGWDLLDLNPQWNPETGLPYHLSEIPELLHIRKAELSPIFNERYHPYCGLLSSMHEWGLYNRRYGLSEVELISHISSANLDAVNSFLVGQLKYQDRLKSQLAASSTTKSFVTPSALMNSYKLLEFFDTLALYFNRSHEGSWKTEAYDHVPIDAENDVTVTVRPVGSCTVSIEPWPFSVRSFEISCDGRYIYPCRNDVDLGKVFHGAAMQTQTFTIRLE